MFIENRHDCNHMLAIISEKGESGNQTNDESNTRNTAVTL